jgi:hypothetical protein
VRRAHHSSTGAHGAPYQSSNLERGEFANLERVWVLHLEMVRSGRLKFEQSLEQHGAELHQL